MNRRRNQILIAVARLLMGGTALMLAHLRDHQKLGMPGVKTRPVAGTNRLDVLLPEQVLDYSSQALEPQPIAVNALPQDTSFGERHYFAADGFQTALEVVLMGSDRTSLHKPQICLRGAGWNIAKTEKAVVPIEKPEAYSLPVTKLTLVPEKPGMFDGRHQLFVYWFVADNQYTREHWQRMWWMFRDLVGTGVLQRWAYVICVAECMPGQEDQTFERMKRFIAAAVPEFQSAPRREMAAVSARP